LFPAHLPYVDRCSPCACDAYTQRFNALHIPSPSQIEKAGNDKGKLLMHTLNASMLCTSLHPHRLRKQAMTRVNCSRRRRTCNGRCVSHMHQRSLICTKGASLICTKRLEGVSKGKSTAQPQLAVGNSGNTFAT
jgi:hypothetical protein